MKRILFSSILFCSSLVTTVYGQSYTFSGTMSNQVMHNYLDRAITMQTFSDVEGDILTESQRMEHIGMLHDIGAKFIGRMAHWWESGWSPKLDGIFAKCKKNVDNLKELDPEVICQAAIFEYVSDGVSSYSIPAYVLTAFGKPVQTRNFNHLNMLYPGLKSQYHFIWGPMTDQEKASVPDITQEETQLWFYYLATKYIDAGCEAIHFGQAEMMNRRDVGNVAYWQLLMKIRAYAATKNRGVVLCDAHVPHGGMFYMPGLASSMTSATWQDYVPPAGTTGILLWDFHSFPLIFRKGTCTATQQYVSLDKNPIDATHKGILGQSWGGSNPQGWYCDHAPLLNEFDAGGLAETTVGCGNTSTWDLWGRDDMSWFAFQPSAYRNQILPYTYYKVKCLDINAHTEMPGLRTACTTSVASSCFNYSALYGGQSLTIKNTWNGSLSGGTNWIHSNKTDEKVMEHPPTGLDNSLAFDNANRIYSITTDGYVIAYQKDDLNNSWMTTNPHLSAELYYGQPVASQVKAKEPVIVSPDGKTILYVGVDNYLHGFKTTTGGYYEYFNLPSSATAYKVINSNVVFASNDRIYYIGDEPGGKRIHGFIRSGSTWLTVSPTYASSPVTVASMQQAAGSLTYDAAKGRIYYAGTDGFLYYHGIIDDWTYSYVAVSKVNMTAQNVRIHANSKLAINGDRIYYIADEPSGKRIHTLIDEPSGWNTFSPTHSAANYNGQPLGWQKQALGNEVAVSPDGNTIAYIGDDFRVYVYQNIGGGWIFAHNRTYEWDGNAAYKGLQFTDNNTMYYISSYPVVYEPSDFKIHQLKFRESYCQNNAISTLEPSFPYSKIALPGGASVTEGWPTITIYPNPANMVVQVKAEGADGDMTCLIRDISGAVIKREVLAANSEVQIATADFTTGLYILTVVDDHGRVLKNEKVTVVH